MVSFFENENQSQKRLDREDFLYNTLPREVIETLSRSFNAKDIELIGKDLFGQLYETHSDQRERLAMLTVSTNTAAFYLVHHCKKHRQLEELICYMIRIDGNLFNAKTASIYGLEGLLHRITQNGYLYSHRHNRFNRLNEDLTYRVDWGALRNDKSYWLTIGSVDICANSKLVEFYGATFMENIYSKLLRHIRRIIEYYDGRIWSWSGDGGLVAFRGEKQIEQAFYFAYELQLYMPVFNLNIRSLIKHSIRMRVGMDQGNIKFREDIGSIISPVINFVSHMEKKATPENGISISHNIFKGLDEPTKKLFHHQEIFEDRKIYSFTVDYESLFPGVYDDSKNNSLQKSE